MTPPRPAPIVATGPGRTAGSRRDPPPMLSRPRLDPPPAPAAPSGVTELLLAWGAGDQGALDLCRYTKQRLVDQQRVAWRNRAQFFGVAAQLMRRILVDHARTRLAAKRGGGAARTTLDTRPRTDSVATSATVLAAVARAVRRVIFSPRN